MQRNSRIEKTIQQIRDSVITLDSGIRFAQHPLYHTIWTDGVFGPEWLRKHITHKLDDLAAALAAKDYNKYVFLHERPYRPLILLELAEVEDIPALTFARLILDVWQDTEFPNACAETWSSLFSLVTVDYLNASLRHEEGRERKRLPSKLDLWRGLRTDNNIVPNQDNGYSWTLTRETAVWFAKRFASLKVGERAVLIHINDVDLSQTVGPLLGRGEQEILIPFPKEALRDIDENHLMLGE